MIWMSPFRRVGSTIQVNYRRTDIAYCQNVTKLYLFSQHRDTELDSISLYVCIVELSFYNAIISRVSFGIYRTPEELYLRLA